ncbi:hypothetical protein P153DRAFT_396585 [Dothidotthia symphoricarpi CBS 119687]|uniref:Uncharacterized protein n=1 Tax=Dothidotthia symphoricarpi CBS 119687 TaxID=1392245 RepID=A0A6A6AE88_9PLEO|nr:uncharacterized protein P153DRAFT_396585 [Dothidotthia symphoricarpi CBS 119687]KAF2129298.1 hypothetical protein P153DRAFT_396585 [Dothidotthia symphoricarpi CBS 119687]
MTLSPEWMDFSDIRRHATQHFKAALDSLPPQFTVKIEKLTEEQIRIPVKSDARTNSVVRFRLLVGRVKSPTLQSIYLYFVEDTTRFLLEKLFVGDKAISKLQLKNAIWEKPFCHLIDTDIKFNGPLARTVALYYLTENGHVERFKEDHRIFFLNFRMACARIFKAQLETGSSKAQPDPTPRTPQESQQEQRDHRRSRGSLPSQNDIQDNNIASGMPSSSVETIAPQRSVQRKRKRDSTAENRLARTDPDVTTNEASEVDISDDENMFIDLHKRLKFFRKDKESKIKCLEAELSQLQQEAKDFEDRAKHAESELDDVKADLAFLRSDQVAMKTEIEDSKARTEELNTQATGLEHAKVELTRSVRQLEAEKKRLEASNAALKTERQGFKDCYEDQKGENAGLMKKNQAQENVIKALEEKHAKTKAQMHALVNELEVDG